MERTRRRRIIHEAFWILTGIAAFLYSLELESQQPAEASQASQDLNYYLSRGEPVPHVGHGLELATQPSAWLAQPAARRVPRFRRRFVWQSEPMQRANPVQPPAQPPPT
jgi:hypothetical protein